MGFDWYSQDSVDSKGLGYEDINTDEWYPSHEEFQYPQSFIDWVDSINSGWQNRKKYKPFETYCKQAEEWLKDTSDITDYDNEEDQIDWLYREIERCRDNTLYFCNKYGWIKEDKADGGALKYKAGDAQKVLLLLCDCGYSLMIGKGRRSGFTTAVCVIPG
jgi:hypothetical protein